MSNVSDSSQIGYEDHDSSQIGDEDHDSSQIGDEDHNSSQIGDEDHDSSQIGNVDHDSSQTGHEEPDSSQLSNASDVFEFDRKSEKWKRLYVKFRRRKRKAVRGRNQNQFADKLIEGSRSNFYRQVRKVGGLKDKNKKLLIASLEGKSDLECAQAIGEEYSAISQAYSPVDLAALPAYLPAQQPPRWGRWKCGEN